jgi:hypothetical protein
MDSRFLTFMDWRLRGKRRLFDLSLSGWPELRWALLLANAVAYGLRAGTA